MIRFLLAFLTTIVAQITIAQTIQTKFYKDRWLEKEVPQQQGSYSKTISENKDSTKTIVVKDLKRDKIIESQAYKGREPFGFWIVSNGSKVLDYNFLLYYNEAPCPDSLKNEAPKGKDEDVNLFIQKNLEYPWPAAIAGLGGRVFLQYTITKEGVVDNVSISKGVDILLDKEAARVVRMLRYAVPATQDIKDHIYCGIIPISFQMR